MNNNNYKESSHIWQICVVVSVSVSDYGAMYEDGSELRTNKSHGNVLSCPKPKSLFNNTKPGEIQ